MGQQQLLLIILGIIVVGLAIIVGLTLFSSSATKSNRDAVIHDLHNLAFRADAYFRKPIMMGGGGFSFVNFQIPTGMSTTLNGSYTILSAGQDSIVIQGTGVQSGDSPSVAGGNIQYQATINQFGISTLNQTN
ncbi:MAG: hypothetical protein Q8903_03370 [Bacteroidota bacterium]|nr:hypothetical protein [Bacteroidota bacterium]